MSNHFLTPTFEKAFSVSSPIFRLSYLWICLLILLPGAGQASPSASIEVASVSPALLRIRLESDTKREQWSFRNSYGPVLGLGERIRSFRALSTTGEDVSVRLLAPGEYRASAPVKHVTYEVALLPPKRVADMSHVSWLDGERGLLLLADLLPLESGLSGTGLSVQFNLPPNWSVASGSTSGAEGYSVPDPDKAVFVVGNAVTELKKRINSTDLRLITSGVWPFKEDQVLKSAAKIIKTYSKITGFNLKAGVSLVLLPYGGGSGGWTADTRGNTVTVLLNSHEPLSRLSIILTHEAFHLWVPNSLDLRGDYDWFFEGFTIYLALRVALETGLTNFAEYLRTLARVYDSYLLAADHDRWSLVELSERRWTSSSSLVYDKGMLVAFIYDLQLRSRTGGRGSLEQIYDELFSGNRQEQRDANEVIISLLGRADGMQDFPRQFVTNAGPLEIERLLASYGIVVQRLGSQTEFKISSSLEPSQSKLLRSLGYKK